MHFVYKGYCKIMGQYQSYYIVVAKWAIFMEQNMRFGLVLGQLAILKKKLGPIEQLLRPLFPCLQGHKKCYKISKSIVMSALKSCIISFFFPCQKCLVLQRGTLSLNHWGEYSHLSIKCRDILVDFDFSPLHINWCK